MCEDGFAVAEIEIGELIDSLACVCECPATGGVYSWGRGLFGRSGVGVFQDELIPTHITVGTNPDVDDDDDRASLGSSHSSTIDTTTSRAAAPHHHPRDKDHRSSKVTQIAAGAYHNLALTADGSVWSWGYNACILLSDFFLSPKCLNNACKSCLCP